MITKSHRGGYIAKYTNLNLKSEMIVAVDGVHIGSNQEMTGYHIANRKWQGLGMSATVAVVAIALPSITEVYASGVDVGHLT